MVIAQVNNKAYMFGGINPSAAQDSQYPKSFYIIGNLSQPDNLDISRIVLTGDAPQFENMQHMVDPDTNLIYLYGGERTFLSTTTYNKKIYVFDTATNTLSSYSGTDMNDDNYTGVARCGNTGVYMKVPLAINSPNITESMISDVAVMPYNNESDAFPVCQLSGAINPSDCTFIPKKDWLTSPAIVKGVHGVYVCDNVKS